MYTSIVIRNACFYPRRSSTLFVTAEACRWLPLICCNRTEGVCVSMCLCVCACLCVISAAQTDRSILMKLYKMIWQIFSSDIFSWILKIRNHWRHSGHFNFFIPAKLRSQFCSNCLQNKIQGTELFPGVCYWKPAKSVSNFRQFYDESHFRKK